MSVGGCGAGAMDKWLVGCWLKVVVSFCRPKKNISAGLEGGNYKAFLVSPMGMARNLMGVTGVLCSPRGRNS